MLIERVARRYFEERSKRFRDLALHREVPALHQHATQHRHDRVVINFTRPIFVEFGRTELLQDVSPDTIHVVVQQAGEDFTCSRDDLQAFWLALRQTQRPLDGEQDPGARGNQRKSVCESAKRLVS